MNSGKVFLFLFIATTLVHTAGLLVRVMDVDAAQYAGISREMLETGEYLQVKDHGHDYLDKPPLIFWLSVLSFKIFGVSTVAYKLPSFLATLLGVYSTYRLTVYLYDQQTALMASLMVYTCQAFFLFNNDVRTDTLLTGFVIFSCWQLVMFSETRKLSHVVFGFIGIGLAMLSKGPIGAVVPASALFVHFAMKREWIKFFRWEWIAGILITLLILFPMLLGLYRQFGKEGPLFYFWTQSFGRITGENKWDNNTGYFFFLREMLWSFIPWTFFMVGAVCYYLFKIFKSKFSKTTLPEFYSIGGFVLPFIALSFSHYKLPHYIFVLYPLLSILTASFITRTVSEILPVRKFYNALQITGLVAFLVLAVLICIYWFPVEKPLTWILGGFGILVGAGLWISFRRAVTALVFSSAMAAITVNFFLNVQVYPSLLKYQSGSLLAEIALKQNIPRDHLYFCHYGAYSFEFYFGTYVPQLRQYELKEKILEHRNSSAGETSEGLWVIGDEKLRMFLQQEQILVKQQIPVDDFHITVLTRKFLSPETRQAALNKVYLLHL